MCTLIKIKVIQESWFIHTHSHTNKSTLCSPVKITVRLNSPITHSWGQDAEFWWKYIENMNWSHWFSCGYWTIINMLAVNMIFCNITFACTFVWVREEDWGGGVTLRSDVWWKGTKQAQSLKMLFLSEAVLGKVLTQELWRFHSIGSLNHSVGQQTHYSHPDEDNLWFCPFVLVVPGKPLSNQAPSSLYPCVAL